MWMSLQVHCCFLQTFWLTHLQTTGTFYYGSQHRVAWLGGRHQQLKKKQKNLVMLQISFFILDFCEALWRISTQSCFESKIKLKPELNHGIEQIYILINEY